MKFKLTKDSEGLVITTKWKKGWFWKKRYVTGVIKFADFRATTLIDRAQLWVGPRDWAWLWITCDRRSFKILSKEEALIWRIEHNI